VLVVYFGIAVGCIIASVYFAGLLIFHGFDTRQAGNAAPQDLVLWDAKLFLRVVLGTLGVVIIGSLLQNRRLGQRR
jgi:hypothetical protein